MNSNDTNVRSQLQVDASLTLKRQIKYLANAKAITVKELVLRALAETYPELTFYVNKDLEKRR